jgi:hypothetical protein
MDYHSGGYNLKAVWTWCHIHNSGIPLKIEAESDIRRNLYSSHRIGLIRRESKRNNRVY